LIRRMGSDHVPSCRACNEFLNGDRVTVRVPDDIVGFIELRDAVLAAKRTHAVERHRVKHEKFEAWERARRSNASQPYTAGSAILGLREPL